MKLSYWYARCLNDSECYSVIAKTKKEAQKQVAAKDHTDFGPVEKRVLEYRDAFDLFDYVTSEGGGRGCGSLG